MKRLTLNALAASAFLLLCGPPLTAQEPRAKPAPQKLALEINDGSLRDRQVDVGAETELGVSSRREQTAGGPPPLTAVRFKSAYEGDAVRVKVSVVFDDSQSAETPGPKYGRKVQDLAAYLVREGETVRVEEFGRFSAEPLSFKVVKAKPRPEPPALSTAPQIANDLKSVEVVSFEPDQSQPPAGLNRYKLRLRNVTERDITALELYEPRPGGRSSMTAAGTPGRPIIRAGGFYETAGGGAARFNARASRRCSRVSSTRRSPTRRPPSKSSRPRPRCCG
ncbi:MAG: hypothetical protein LC800_07430 [Acidobacteria bacterium]|nr:hypothetical protein [Acidobacteriota bacterium]